MWESGVWLPDQKVDQSCEGEEGAVAARYPSNHLSVVIAVEGVQDCAPDRHAHENSSHDAIVEAPVERVHLDRGAV